MKVHELPELRRETAVSLGLLPKTYKFKLCGEYTEHGSCKQGVSCFDAHSIEDLRCAAPPSPPPPLTAYIHLDLVA